MRDNMVLRTFYIDSDIDDENRAWLDGDVGSYSSMLFRHWLSAGMKAADRGTPLPPQTPQKLPQVLHAFRVDARMDSRLHREAFRLGVPRAELVMGYIRLGKQVASPLTRHPLWGDAPDFAGQVVPKRQLSIKAAPRKPAK